MIRKFFVAALFTSSSAGLLADVSPWREDAFLHAFDETRDPVLYDQPSAYFKEDEALLAVGGVQIGAAQIYKEEFTLEEEAFEDEFGFRKDVVEAFDIGIEPNGTDVLIGADRLTDQIKEGEFILFAKSVNFFPKKTPSFFKIRNVTRPAYMRVSMPEYNSQLVLPRPEDMGEGPAMSEKPLHTSHSRFVLGYTIAVNNFWAEYDFERNKGVAMGSVRAEGLAELRDDFGKKPSLITTTFAAKKDISEGSYGSRTINYYYDVAGKGTLLVSMKMASFKKETTITWNLVRVWAQLANTAMQRLKDGTFRSLSGIRALDPRRSL